MGTDRVVLLGWYGSSNTGDEAVLEAAVRALRQRGIGDLHVLSTDPARTRSALGVQSTPRMLTPATVRAVLNARALLLAGGGLIQDGTSVFNLPVYAAFVALARLRRVPIIGWGMGVEPLWTRLGEALARFVVGSSVRFSVRDSTSHGLLRRAGVASARIIVAADLAFLAEPQPALLHAGEPPEVVFSLRDLSDNHPGLNAHYLLPVHIRKRLGLGWKPPSEQREALIAAAAAGVAWCVQSRGAHVTLLSLWPGRDDEILEAVREAALATGTPSGSVNLNLSPGRPDEVARLIGRARLLVSMRLHALLFAASAGVPALALSYARKMRAQMRALGQERWVVEVARRTPSADEVIMKMEALWQDSDGVAASTREAAARARAAAATDADEVAAVLLSRSAV